MAEIRVEITEKTAAVRGKPQIVCGNSDYVLRFAFDAEWDAYSAKTARFVYYRGGTLRYEDVLFEGDSVSVPVLHDVDEVAVGVYAGDLHTTTPARIPCARAITDGNAVHNAPAADLYNQLMDYMMRMQIGARLGQPAALLQGTRRAAIGRAQRVTTEIDMAEEAWETGSGNINTGAFDNPLTTRLRCNAFTAVPAERFSAQITAYSAGGAGLESVIYWYSAAAESSYLSCRTWSVNGTDLPVPEGARYFRLNLKIDNVTEMVPADLASCTVTFLN